MAYTSQVRLLLQPLNTISLEMLQNRQYISQSLMRMAHLVFITTRSMIVKWAGNQEVVVTHSVTIL